MKEFIINSDNTIDIDLRKNTLLEASAGTGKTYSLERVVLNLIKDKKYDLTIKDILVVTFTNKATREMKDRVRKILVEEYRSESDLLIRKRLEDAIGAFDEAAIFTIHSFCQNTLQSFPFESNSLFSQEINQDESILEAAVWDYLRKIEGMNDGKILEEYTSFRGNKDFSDVVRELINLYKREELREDIQFYPSREDYSLFDKLRYEFDNGQGSLYKILEEFAEYDAGVFHEVSKSMGVSTRKTSFEKLEAGFRSVELDKGFLCFMDIFYKKGFCENAYKLSSEFLEKKSKKGLKVAELDNAMRDIALNFDDLFASLDFLFDKENLTGNPINKFFAGEFIKRSLEEIDIIFKEKQEKSGVLSYNDLINNLHKMVIKKGHNPLLLSLKSRYKVALIDEFQDTDKKQWDIFRRIFGEDKDHNFFLIGDPKQSIYGFRGADLEIYYKAKESVDDENRYYLGTNYRSESGIVKAGNLLFSKVFDLKTNGNTKPTRFNSVNHSNKSPRTIDSVTQNVEFLVYDKEVKEGKYLTARECKKGYFKAVVNKIVLLLTNNRNSLNPGDIAVLVESHKDSLYLRDHLLNRGVPVVISRQKNVYCSEEADTILTLLRALNRPGNISELKAVLLSPIFGYSLKEIHDMESLGELEVVSSQFFIWSQTFLHSGIISFWKEVESYSLKGHLQTRLLSTINGERSYTNYTHLIENLNIIQKKERLNSLSLYQRLLHLTLSSSEDEENSIRLDRESQAVQIMTIHASKGLEFPVVFFAGGLSKSGAGAGSYGIKYADKKGQWTVDFLTRSKSRILAERDDWEERKRLYYVAFTRASSKVYMPLFPNGELMVLNNIYASLCWNENKLLIEDRMGDYLEMCEQPIHRQLKLGKSKLATEIKKSYIQKNYEDVLDMVAGSPDLFNVDSEIYNEKSFTSYEVEHDNKELRFESLQSSKGFKERTTWVSSYSGLTKASHGSASKEDADREDDEEEVIIQHKKSDEINGFNIPGGATFGDLVHECFEQINFGKYTLSLDEFLIDDDVNDLFLSEAKKHFDQEWAKKYGNASKTILWNTLNSKINVGDKSIILGTFHEGLRIHEREFFFRIDIENSFYSHGLGLHVEEGYLKGFIDLILNYNNRYYIADWKTTTIRGREAFDDYCTVNIEKSMKEHHYHLQGLIYTVALYLHLEKTKKDFDYNMDIGGYFYFFVRGMHPDNNTGISFYKPTEAEVLGFIKDVRGPS